MAPNLPIRPNVYGTSGPTAGGVVNENVRLLCPRTNLLRRIIARRHLKYATVQRHINASLNLPHEAARNPPTAQNRTVQNRSGQCAEHDRGSRRAHPLQFLNLRRPHSWVKTKSYN
ncbi:dephospho-CoA kinase [Striga asiatica]|uniref:Dephospho-CoA kinase n=1 Tax=Striga asiatica TaxID=4170 RepID=A0A5A7QAJ7_STRAF|nr:dephospho-CoA kinase [Striga asiatica]